MPIPGFGRRRDALVQNFARFIRTGFLDEHLREHQVCRDVISVALQKFAEIGFRGCSITGVGTLHCQAVSRKCVVRFLRNEGFQQLSPAFLLASHRVQVV